MYPVPRRSQSFVPFLRIPIVLTRYGVCCRFGSKSLIWSRQGGEHSAIYVGRRLRRGYGKTQICSRRNEATGIEALFDRITRNGRASKTGSSSVFGFRNQRASRRGSYRTTLYEALQDQQLTRRNGFGTYCRRQLVVGLEQAPRLGSFLGLGLG